MASLSPASTRHKQALARLRAYVPPPTQYYNTPLSRRAAVLILLFADPHGDLKVVLTMRSKTLSSYAGHAALPGGKADSLSETPFQTARREAYEEIGLPLTDSKLPYPFRVEHLCQLPANLAKTELGVRPCVAYLSPTRAEADAPRSQTVDASKRIEETLIPRLDAKEVAAVFTAPFQHFLHASSNHSNSSAQTQGDDVDSRPGAEAAGFPADWYRGTWTDWHESRWRMHSFFVPVNPKSVTLPKNEKTYLSSDPPARFRVFGMTARILVDCARVAYAQEPQFEHNSRFGDEEMIGRLIKLGRFAEERKSGDELTKDILKQASKI
ncbi:hypothetical protein EJ05DRAFT_502112 [Pseudovirgaria hyperparasitica]|uniref:Nudix hydrolase domain-containing protein n=1 Tax=Pseudovirgaria hyperparasitica TaxID=470096 RepID=A0A6A6W233_9PEZI|nr:uncharacterized protein EJ05DRAFT_502112 [Pseudovirgaria hyperparasitica]KAF2756615.1 hypothetical protein EJ05DRAFT_502112 [Pseudovirgaria hyperparasitica]